MRSPFRIAIPALILGIVVIQFFQPERNLGSGDRDQDPLAAFSMSDSVAVLLRRACLDCHSNHTDYPWYSRISPVSWYLNKHIVEGKDAFNFSNFQNMEKIQKIGALGDICDVVESGAMPLRSYLLIHRNARIGPSDVEAICTWSDDEAGRILMLKE